MKKHFLFDVEKLLSSKRLSYKNVRKLKERQTKKNGKIDGILTLCEKEPIVVNVSVLFAFFCFVTGI